MTLDSDDPPVVVVERLRARAKEWRESTLTTRARAAGIIGWVLGEAGQRIVLRPLIVGQNGWLPHFVGEVRATESGSRVIGELRLHWFSRGFMLVWFTVSRARLCWHCSSRSQMRRGNGDRACSCLHAWWDRRSRLLPSAIG